MLCETMCCPMHLQMIQFAWLTLLRLSCSWSFYPLIWGLADGANLLSHDAEVTLWRLSTLCRLVCTLGFAGTLRGCQSMHASVFAPSIDLDLLRRRWSGTASAMYLPR